MSEFPHLLAPMTLRGHLLRNRIGFAALSTRFAEGGRVSARMIHHLAARARGGAALVITEALSASPSAATPVRVAAYDEAALPGLAELAAEVARHGGLPIGQLWHGGSAHHGPRGLDAVGPSAIADGMSWTVPRVLSGIEVEGLVSDYAQSAQRLQRAGFAGVEVSAAHGFLPLQFLSPVTNHREDGWGGDAAGRSRFVREILRAIRTACGSGFLVGLKLPADDGVEGSIGPAEAGRITCRIVADTPPDWLCFSQGSHGWSLHQHAPDMHDPVAPYRTLWRAMRQAAGNVPIAAIGRVVSPAMAENILAAGEAELVMLARPLLADPDWPAKAASGRAAEITPCIHCNACWGEIHRGVPTGCSVNPLVGTARDGASLPPALTRRHVVVVGAGIAGLQAAAAAAERGHRVTLVGASAQPGGKAALHARLPGCGDIAHVLSHLVQRVRRAGVELRLGQEASPEDVFALAPDDVVLATGAFMTPVPGLKAPDLRGVALDLLEGQLEGGRRALLVDMDATPATYDAAELLTAHFDHLVLVTPREAIARDSPLLVAQGIQRRLAARGVAVLTCQTVTDWRADGVTLRHVLTRAISVLEGVDLVAVSTPRSPRDRLLTPLRAAGLRVRAVGDALAPRLMLSAVREGQEAGEAV